MVLLSRRIREEKDRLSQLAPDDVDEHSHITGVLLSDEIEFYVDRFRLIHPFDKENLKPAAYELTIGESYFLSGQFLTLDTDHQERQAIVLPPFEVAVIQTRETLRLPRYLIGRWNIRVKHAYSGLLWVGGPQVDPGYVGHLYCPIYNLSDKPVTLHIREPIAVIDFVKTTPFNEGKSKSYVFPPKRVLLEEYGIEELRSALFHKAGLKLVEFEEQIRSVESRFLTFIQISFGIFALIVTVVVISITKEAELSVSLFGAATMAISAAAVLIAFFSYVQFRVGRAAYEQYGRLMGTKFESVRKFLRRTWGIGIAVSMAFAIGGAWALYKATEPLFTDLRQELVITRADLDLIKAELDQLKAELRGEGEPREN